MGRPRRARTHARQEAPVPRPPGSHGGRHPKRGRTPGGAGGGARTHAPAARRLTMSPGESASASPSPSPTPQGSPGVCLRQSGWLGRRTPGPSPSSPGGRARGFGRACPGRGGSIHVIQACDPGERQRCRKSGGCWDGLFEVGWVIAGRCSSRSPGRLRRSPAG